MENKQTVILFRSYIHTMHLLITLTQTKTTIQLTTTTLSYKGSQTLEEIKRSLDVSISTFLKVCVRVLPG